jgi:hypothetical protein
MKAMQRDPQASDKARRAERRLDERGGGLISIRPVRLDGGPSTSSAAAGGTANAASTPTQPARTGGAGFKKGGFKSAFGGGGGEAQGARGEAAREGVDEDEDEDLGYERYDPRRPTGCSGSCGVR